MTEINKRLAVDIINLITIWGIINNISKCNNYYFYMNQYKIYFSDVFAGFGTCYSIYILRSHYT